MPGRTFNAVLIGVIFCFFILPISAQEISNSSPVYEKTTVLIPMRDGVRLNTSIYAPKNAAAPLPFLMKRSPYGVGDGVSPEAFSNPQSSMRELVDESYIFVFQDIRGKYKSEGKFVMQRPPRDRKNSQAIDESTDAYDTIEWLLKNVPNHNGRAGIFGVSYDGWLAAMAMLDPHPALKAVSPQASPADMFLGDDFHRNGRLSFDSPHEAGEQEFDSYVSDPAYPVPYRPRPIEPTYYPAGSGWSTWLLEDQRFAHNRPDVLSWESAPLQEEVAITGNIVAHLFASTSGTDSDWIVKLIDVYPEHYPKDVKMSGYQLMIANEVFRGRFRSSFEKPEPIAPNQVNEYVIDLHSLNHRFGARHRIMVQVQSTWFPVIDRNPQKYVENIFLAKDSDYKPATQRVFRSQPFPSHVSVPVVVQ